MSEFEVPVLVTGSQGRRRRIGIMGGTFDPIHHGHLVAASEVLSVFNLDEVIFVPTGNQPYKQDRDVTLAEHRYLMAVVATASTARPSPRLSRRRLLLHHRGRRAASDPRLEEFGRAMVYGTFRRRDSARSSARYGGAASRGDHPHGDPRDGHLFDGLPESCEVRHTTVVSRTRRRGAIHRQVSALSGRRECRLG